MKEKNSALRSKILVSATFVFMIVMNALANIVPINGVTTGQVSDRYANLFAPAGFTFGIWGLIYALLLVYTLYQMELFKQLPLSISNRAHKRIKGLYALSSLMNGAWILAWHYDLIGASVLLMLGILYALIRINQITFIAVDNKIPRYFLRLPFEVYFGWITVATIANITTWLVSVDWSGFGLSEVAWTVLVLCIGAIIGTVTLIRLRSIPYGMVLVWAYWGILTKHMASWGFQRQHSPVIVTVGAAITFFVLAMGMLLYRRKDIK